MKIKLWRKPAPTPLPAGNKHLRIGPGVPGPRRRNWIDHTATTARWALLGLWLGPLIGGWA